MGGVYIMFEKKQVLEKWYDDYSCDNMRMCLSDNTHTYTREDVEILSGKIYAYLKKNKVGTNDFVLIDLPRASNIFIAMLGVAKAGAGFVVVESILGKERREYIRLNTNSKLVVNEELLTQIEKIDYIKGYESIDEHDIAFAIYTSGTTGNPKGVVHEYGNYKMLYQSIIDTDTGELRENEETKFLNVAPFNFVASVMIFVLWLYSGGTVFTPDYDVIKNIKKLVEYSTRNKLNETFLSPSLLRLIGDKLNPEMKLIYTGSESANNVSFEQGDLYNFYLMSETAFVICQYKIEKPMNRVPIGKPNPGVEVSISKDGEIICRNPYCRGYLNDDERDSFKDGYYYTGDIAELDKDGNFILKGRNVDMIKINGNRVEPLEVEAVVKRLMKDMDCAVKGFENNEDAYLCLYYVCEKEIDREVLVSKMKEYLPYYMIPKHFIKIDALPKTRLGKLNRKALKTPARELHFEYVAPTNDMERQFCRVFEKVLNVENIGIDTDLFEAGLTSISAIEAITELDIDEIESRDIYTTRTIRELVKFYDREKEIYLTSEEKEQLGRKQLYPHRSQPIIEAYRVAPFLTGFNLSIAFKFNRLIDAEKLKNAINKYTDQSSTYKMLLIDDAPGRTLQKYAPELYKPINVELMTEDEVEELRKTFVQPFDLFSELPYRFRVIKTSKNSYLFVDVHHTIIDGMGMVNMGNDIINAYLGKPTSENNYFAFAFDQNREMKSIIYKNGLRAAREKYLGREWGKTPRGQSQEVYFVRTEHDTQLSVKKIKKYIERNNITRNVLFSSALSLVLSKMNEINDNLFTWAYQNRDINGNQAGCRVVAKYFGIHLDKRMRIYDLYSLSAKEIQFGIAALYSITDITEINSLQLIAVDDLGDIEEPNILLSKVATPVVLERPNDTVLGSGQGYTTLNFLNRKGHLIIRIDTDNNVIDETTRNNIMNSITTVLRRLVDNDESVITDFVN